MKDIHGGNIWQEAEKKGWDPAQIIDFSASINPLGIPAEIKVLLEKSVNNLIHYPDPRSSDLLKRLAEIHACPWENILVGNGSTELIYLLVKALSPKTIFIPSPFFSEYEKAAKVHGVKTVFIKTRPKDNFKLDIMAMEKALAASLKDEPALLFFGHPTSPSGSMLSPSELMEVLKITRKYKIRLVVDEVFLEFSPEAESLSLIREIKKNKQIIVLRSLTKIFAIPGLRLGYLAASPAIAARIREIQPPWSVNYFAQVAGKSLLQEKDYIVQVRDFILKEKEFLWAGLQKISGIEVFPSAANFFLIKIKNHLTAADLRKKLLEKKILIRDLGNMRGLNKSYFRVAVKKRGENILLLESLTQLCRN